VRPDLTHEEIGRTLLECVAHYRKKHPRATKDQAVAHFDERLQRSPSWVYARLRGLQGEAVPSILPDPDTARVDARYIAAQDAIRDAAQAILELIAVETSPGARRELGHAHRELRVVAEGVKLAKELR
jgi:hypothetical protein